MRLLKSSLFFLILLTSICLADNGIYAEDKCINYFTSCVYDADCDLNKVCITEDSNYNIIELCKENYNLAINTAYRAGKKGFCASVRTRVFNPNNLSNVLRESFLKEGTPLLDSNYLHLYNNFTDVELNDDILNISINTVSTNNSSSNNVIQNNSIIKENKIINCSSLNNENSNLAVYIIIILITLLIILTYLIYNMNKMYDKEHEDNKELKKIINEYNNLSPARKIYGR